MLPHPNDVHGGFTPETAADGDRLDDGGVGGTGPGGAWGLDSRIAVGIVLADGVMEGELESRYGFLKLSNFGTHHLMNENSGAK